MAPQAPTRKRQGGSGSSAPQDHIPDKLYFRIGEVAKLCGVPAYVLRFWEGEFPQLKPNKGGTGQRLYRRRDVEMALKVKALLYDEGYTIAGARQAFKTEARAGSAKANSASAKANPAALEDGSAAPGQEHAEAERAVPASRGVDTSALEALRKDLRDLHALLSRPAAARATVQPIRAIRQATPEPPMPVPLPPPTPFARPRLISSTRPAPKPAEAPARGLFDDLQSTE